MADTEQVPPNATVYARNLDEKVKIPALIEALHELFDVFGTVVDIVAKKSLKRKGQAFIVYDNVESAQDAIEDLQSFDLFGKPMKLEFAKSRSDVTVQREDGEAGLETHKKHRIAEKERKQAQEAAAAAATAPAKRAPAENIAERPAKSAKPAAGAGGVIPDEFLPPNKTLFLRDLPEGYGQDALAVIFKRFPGFREIRTVPGRGNIAFAEYDDETGAIAAKEALSGIELSGQPISVTYQRQ
ncbi:hypothetical protein WHR41_03217 [Cladosporium halotolerans]|uniref:RRM domain-containing protein n=1 Tax=Cladosporium halotolerans TaxID=1052096 RepID=A0AB34KXY4_9PEZI